MARGKIEGNRPARNHQPCKVCGEPVETIRLDAITCSNRCRQKRKRSLARLRLMDTLQSRIAPVRPSRKPRKPRSPQGL